MEKSKFILKLEALLKKVPEHDRKEMLYDFEEHFQIGFADGRTEDEIAAELGDPNVIARDLLAEYRLTRAESDQSIPNMFNAIIATISLSFFNLVFILGPVIGILGVYIGLCAAALVMMLSPLAIIGSIIFNGFHGLLLLIFASMITCSLGVLLSIGMIYVGKFLYRLILKYIRFNIRVIKGEKGAKAA